MIQAIKSQKLNKKMFIFDRIKSTLEMLLIKDARSFDWAKKYPNILHYCSSIVFKSGEGVYSDLLRGGVTEISEDGNFFYNGMTVNEMGYQVPISQQFMNGIQKNYENL
jgi:hypothetical protein